jgi:tetratricopeptide (TPR) repeat protein
MLDGAIICFQEAIKIRPSHIAAHIDLGLAYIQSLDFSSAIEAFRNAISLNTDIPVLYKNLGDSYRLNGNNLEAIKSYE